MKLPTPPVSRRLAARLLRAIRSGLIEVTTIDEHSCVEALTCGFVGDKLRQRLVGLWLKHGHTCIQSEDQSRRKPEDDGLDKLLNEV